MDGLVEKCDICIIGASIAGNYLGYLLYHSNLNIIIIEEHKNVGLPFQCAGIVSKKLSKLINLPENIILNRVKIAKLVSPSNKSLRLYGNEEPFIVDRIALDQLFYKKLEKSSNVKYLLGEKFKSFQYKKKRKNKKEIEIQTSKRKIVSKLLIGCDGPFSSVGKHVGVNNKVIYATQIRIKGLFNEQEAVMHFDNKWNDLFGWIVPEGNKIFRVGLACSKNIKENFNNFLKRINIDFNKKIDQQGGIIPVGMMNKVSYDNVMLIGDSACQVKATTGGGIIMLLIASKYAANCIIKCFKSNNFSKKYIKKNYEKPCFREIGKELKTHYLIRNLLKYFKNQDFDEFFTIIENSDIKNIISFYGDMDFPKKLLFKLLKNPYVFRFLLKFFIKKPKFLLKSIFLLK
ncbi:MAG: NAD(P)/FAD-dependent oxidoreductase [Candidatus Lokiarchaeota archaeon]|nr:NAD(P)/FAD-dependent oxidoreductase [Candidatus Lokiarchaeota archaeon]